MKKLNLLLLIAGLALASCKKGKTLSARLEDSAGKYGLNVHLHSNFGNDQVAVFIDGREIFNGAITTNHSLGLAQQISGSGKFGKHAVKVAVNNQHTGSIDVFLKQDLWIGVGYDADQVKFNFVVSEKQFYYN